MSLQIKFIKNIRICMFNLIKFGKLLLELKAENRKLKNELHISNCRIVDSANEI